MRGKGWGSGSRGSHDDCLDLEKSASREKFDLMLRRSVSPKSKVPGWWDQRWTDDKRLGNGPKLQGDRWVLWFKGDVHQRGAVKLL